jgi:hypothetical protein
LLQSLTGSPAIGGNDLFHDISLSISHGDPLERIVELEEKLAADRGRKPKFQKPKLQQAWQAELQELYKQI